MNDQKTALHILELLWHNYYILGQEVDVHRMSSDRLDLLIEHRVSPQPLLTAAWLATQGFFISAWSLWECYSRHRCEGLPNKVNEKGKSHAQWVAETFTANGTNFAEKVWFIGGNAVRNLIAHHAARVTSPDAERWWKKAQAVFKDLQLDPDSYLKLNHDHAADLKVRVDEFIRDATLLV